jgi:MFS family permease
MRSTPARSLARTPAISARAIALTYAISILLAWPLGWLADRYHPLRVGAAVLSLYALCMLAAWRLVDERRIPGGADRARRAGRLLPDRHRVAAAGLAAARALFAAGRGVGVADGADGGGVDSGAGRALDAMGRDYRLLYLAGAGGRLRCGAVVQPAQTLFVREVAVDFFQRFAACFRQQEGRGQK